MGYSDADSLIIDVETEDIYEYFKELNEHIVVFWLSQGSSELWCYKQKKLGKFKDEMNGKLIIEFIGLIPKMYSFKIDENYIDTNTRKKYKKAKGVPKENIKTSIKLWELQKDFIWEWEQTCYV